MAHPTAVYCVFVCVVFFLHFSGPGRQHRHRQQQPQHHTPPNSSPLLTKQQTWEAAREAGWDSHFGALTNNMSTASIAGTGTVSGSSSASSSPSDSASAALTVGASSTSSSSSVSERRLPPAPLTINPARVKSTIDVGVTRRRNGSGEEEGG